MHIIFSFREYQIKDGTPKLKDIYLIALDESFLVDYAYHASIIEPNKLDSRSQTSLKDDYDYGGIEWENYEETYQNIKQPMRDYLENSTFIYVENLPQKKILIDLVGLRCINKIICLDEFGFKRPQYSPNLSIISLFKRDKRRLSRQESYSAHDILIRMKDWLEKSKLYIATHRDIYVRENLKESPQSVHRIRKYSSSKFNSKYHIYQKIVRKHCKKRITHYRRQHLIFLKMEAILDFNGYFRGKKYKIKEYSLYVIRGQTYDVVSHYLQVSKPPKCWHTISLENRNNYKTYFKRFGIGWKTGTHNEKLITNNFWDALRNVEAVYVINQGKRQLLENYFDKFLPFKFIYLNDLGFDFEPQMTTQCRYHKKKENNNCAGDNTLAMIKWLKKVKINHVEIPGENKNILIDFNGYFLSDTEYIIKEYSLYIFRDKTNEIISKDFQVSKPPVPCYQLDNVAQDNYSTYYDSYGIGWSEGKIVSAFIRNDLQQKLQNSRNIYVRDQTQKELLISYLDQDFNAVCLADVGLNFVPQMKTDCKNHAEPDKNNCAQDNTSKMLKWLFKRNSDDYNLSSEDKNVILDFNGYYFSYDEFVIKEYSLYVVHNKTSDIIYHDSGVSEPLYLCHQIDEVDQKNYSDYYNDYGIDWGTGTRDINFIKRDLQKLLRTSKNIYVQDQFHKNKLNRFLNHDFKAISLEDLDLEFEPVEGINCKNHKHPDKNICANDNAVKMLVLLGEKVLYPISRAKENVVIDFNGFFINDQFVVKEYSLYVIDDETNQIIINLSGVLGLPIIQKDNVDKQSLENIDLYTKNFGIDWNSLGSNYGFDKHNLQTRLNVSNKVFVIDRSKHQLLLNCLENDLSPGFVYLADLGFKFEPKMTTACKNHKERSKNNCANDNVEVMLRWLIDRYQRIGSGSRLKTPEKHIIVDFFGNSMKDNNFAICKLSAIIANKRIPDDVNLYLSIKIPAADNTAQDDRFHKDNEIDGTVLTTDLEQLPMILIDYFKTATHIYVKNLSKQKLLERYIGEDHNIIYLESLGFRSKQAESDKCTPHEENRGICRIDHSKNMLQWFMLNIGGFLSKNDEIEKGHDSQIAINN
ncbi:hypothetical protein KQX54_014254 [Cotesia glomerata]|uniref:Uncharacterized protein n=1 Tax=Cotesia glomerata TaxID=32391 RepID=A0AAV7IQT5_COTGL|nr:hypothetical protein KQX54_014254 [Cotesia glomerata]